MLELLLCCSSICYHQLPLTKAPRVHRVTDLQLRADDLNGDAHYAVSQSGPRVGQMAQADAGDICAYSVHCRLTFAGLYPCTLMLHRSLHNPCSQTRTSRPVIRRSPHVACDAMRG
jgi:hypothetical protein